MDMKFQLKTSMQQRLVMTPKLQQALKLLQVPTLELEHILKQEIMQNPLLEEVDYGEEEEEEVRDDSAEDSAEEAKEESSDSGADDEPTQEFELDEYLDDSFKVMGWEPEREDLDERFERVAVAPENGVDQLVTQLHLAVDELLDMEIGEYLIGNLNPDGFLVVELDEVARVFEVDEERVKSVLGVIQSFDPPGIGARNLQESLLLQLKARGQENTLVTELVEDHFEALKNRKFAEIARELKVSPKEVQQMASRQDQQMIHARHL